MTLHDKCRIKEAGQTAFAGLMT